MAIKRSLNYIEEVMKSRPEIFSKDSHKIKKVKELSKEGDYLEEKFYKSKISEGTKSIYGYKEFQIPEDFKGYDRGLYETLIGNTAKCMFATYVREMELGEFKNNQLNGFGARYLTELPGHDDTKDEYFSCGTSLLVGNFVNGLPNNKILYSIENSDHEDSAYALSIWKNGKVTGVYWDYKNKDFDVRDEIFESRFWLPWGTQRSKQYKNEKWWEAYKHEFLIPLKNTKNIN